MKVPACPPPIVSIHTWASAKRKNKAVTTRRVGFQNPKARLNARRDRPNVVPV